MAAPMSTSMDFKEQLQFPIKRIVIRIAIHIKYRDTYRLWKRCIATPLIPTRSVVFYYTNTFSCILLCQHVQLYFTIPIRSVVFYYTNTFSCILLYKHVQLYFTIPTRSVVFYYTFSCILLCQHVQLYFTTRSVVFYYTFSCILLCQHVQLYLTTRSVVFYYANTFSCIFIVLTH